MSKKENGGTAFPGGWNESGNSGEKGMSLRDYFAAKAMQSGLRELADVDREEAERCIPIIAAASYRIADAMLAERAKGESA